MLVCNLSLRWLGEGASPVPAGASANCSRTAVGCGNLCGQGADSYRRTFAESGRSLVGADMGLLSFPGSIGVTSYLYQMVMKSPKHRLGYKQS